MHFVLLCRDRPGASDLRQSLRPAHLEFVERNKAHVKLAGPLLSDGGTMMIGSLFILDYPDRAAVQAFNAGDPYTQGGLFVHVEILPWRRVLGASLD